MEYSRSRWNSPLFQKLKKSLDVRVCQKIHKFLSKIEETFWHLREIPTDISTVLFIEAQGRNLRTTGQNQNWINWRPRTKFDI